MKKILPISIAAVAVMAGCAVKDSQIAGHSADVNPMVGTDFTGNTYPGAQAPHGMVQLSPDNGLPGWDRIAGYFYPDSTIAGFSHTHLSGTGAGDGYDISFLPLAGAPVTAPQPLGIHSRFSHDREQARAGYYCVHLDDYDVEVELTATPRVGVQRYTWPGDTGIVIINLTKAMNWDATAGADIQVADSVTLIGHRFSTGWARDQKVWFATRFSQPWESMSVDTTGGGAIATLRFATAPGATLTVCTALSGTDASGAWANLAAEAPHDDFDRYLAQTTMEWDNALAAIEIDVDDRSVKRTFYTALYHSLLCPELFSDVDGRYRGPDGEIHANAPQRPHYHMFSLWDTYRAAHPLYTIIEPDAAGDMARSLVDFARQGGRLPVWTMWAGETDMMIGYHSAPVIVDAIFKGLGDIDPAEALELCVATARLHDHRWVACDSDASWSMSKTLEYAYDDACIAALARKLGRDDIYVEFTDRAARWRNVFDPETKFFRPRLSDGSFFSPFAPEDYSDHICESNAWQYLWSVQHDPEALAEALGGRDSLEARLDRFFTLDADSASLPIFSTGMIGQYAHGNEPGHHAAYLYNLTSHPEKGRGYLRQIMGELYSDTPDGLCGNEDCGQMSAWYVLSALGIYPLDPASGRYELGAPVVKRAEIRLPDGKKFVITADPSGDYQDVMLNGRSLDRTYITHQELMAGGTLEFL